MSINNTPYESVYRAAYGAAPPTTTPTSAPTTIPTSSQYDIFSSSLTPIGLIFFVIYLTILGYFNIRYYRQKSGDPNSANHKTYYKVCFFMAGVLAVPIAFIFAQLTSRSTMR